PSREGGRARGDRSPLRPRRSLVCRAPMRIIVLAFLFAACSGPAAAPHRAHYDAVPRLRFNQLALRLDLPLFWASDGNGNSAVDPDEVRALLFYPAQGHWVQ